MVKAPQESGADEGVRDPHGDRAAEGVVEVLSDKRPQFVVSPDVSQKCLERRARYPAEPPSC